MKPYLDTKNLLSVVPDGFVCVSELDLSVPELELSVPEIDLSQIEIISL